MEAGPDTARVNEYIFRIQQLVQSSNPHVLHFDCTVGDLRAWLWPITNAGHRVTPEDLAIYRASGFRRPCCLCAVPKLDGVSSGYAESTVILAVDGEHSGGFLLTCAENNCAYQVPVDRAYASTGLPLKRYTRLHAGTRYTRMRTANRMPVGQGQRSRENGNVLLSLARGIRRSAPLAVQDSPVSKLIRLNSFVFPGLPEKDFENLFTKCRKCGWIMTRRAFKYHSCQPVVPTAVIDLTMDSDEVMDLTMDSDEEIMDLTVDSDEEAMDLTMDSSEEIIDLTMEGGDEE